MKLQYESGSEDVDKQFTVGADEMQKLGGEGMELTLQKIDAKPGDLFPIYLQYGDAEGKQLMVPVLDGTLPEYEALLP